MKRLGKGVSHLLKVKMGGEIGDGNPPPLSQITAILTIGHCAVIFHISRGTKKRLNCK
jgi:hypothetical protein